MVRKFGMPPLLAVVHEGMIPDEGLEGGGGMSGHQLVDSVSKRYWAVVCGVVGAFFLVDQTYLGGRPVGRQGLMQEAIYHQKEERL